MWGSKSCRVRVIAHIYSTLCVFLYPVCVLKAEASAHAAVVARDAKRRVAFPDEFKKVGLTLIPRCLALLSP